MLLNDHRRVAAVATLHWTFDFYGISTLTACFLIEFFAKWQKNILQIKNSPKYSGDLNPRPRLLRQELYHNTSLESENGGC